MLSKALQSFFMVVRRTSSESEDVHLAVSDLLNEHVNVESDHPPPSAVSKVWPFRDPIWIRRERDPGAGGCSGFIAIYKVCYKSIT